MGTIKENRRKLENDLSLLRIKRQEVLNSSGLEDLEKTASDFIARFDTLRGIEKRNFIERMIAKIVLREGNKIEFHVCWSPVTSVTGMTESSTRCDDGEYPSIIQNSSCVLINYL